MHHEIKTAGLLDLSQTLGKPLLESYESPWEALPGLKAFLLDLGKSLDPTEYEEIKPGVWIARDAMVAASASVEGPCIVDHGAEIRHCAYIRGSALVGKNAVVGISTELKNALLFDAVQVPHFNYVGDSILGYRAHLGAGAITSNVKSDHGNVTIRLPNDARLETGMRKLGAILGDGVEVGCNAVLCPGAIIGRGSMVYPTACVRGVVPARHIYKGEGLVIPMRDLKGSV